MAERDIRGDLHTHTDLTDGLASLEDMVPAAASRGYRYYAITDHAPNRSNACAPSCITSDDTPPEALTSPYGLRIVEDARGP